MRKKKDELKLTLQQDERVIREIEAIFSEGDLKELINYTYCEYQYKGSQLGRLVKLIGFLALESNRFTKPELAVQCQRLNDFLNTFQDFLQRNFREGDKSQDGEIIYFFQSELTSSENEAFLVEFQMVSMDLEKAYRNYRAAARSELKQD